MLPIWLLAAMMMMIYDDDDDDDDVLLEFWEPCANAMLVVFWVSQPFRQRARALAENDSLQRVPNATSRRIVFPLTRARVGGKL